MIVLFQDLLSTPACSVMDVKPTHQIAKRKTRIHMGSLAEKGRSQGRGSAQMELQKSYEAGPWLGWL